MSDERIVELGAGMPAWVLRVALLLACLGAAVAQRGDGVVLLSILLVLALASAAVPASPAPALLIAVVAISVATAGGPLLRPGLLVEIPLLHLVHVLSAITALLPNRSVVRPSALIRPAIRFAISQLGVFAVAVLAEMLPTAENTVFVEIAGLIAATGLVVVAISVLTRSK